MICAAAVTAQFVGGKATRDALYLANLDVTSLPMMVVATSIFSIALVAVASQAARGPCRRRPSCRSPSSSSALLLLVGWGLSVRRAARRRGRDLPADLRPRADARIGLLADRHRALRPAHREAALRTDRRRGHARRPARRPARRAGGAPSPASAAMLPVLAVDQPPLRVADPAPGAAGRARAPGRHTRQRARSFDAPPTRSGLRVLATRRTSGTSPPSSSSARSARRSSTTSSRCRRSPRFGRGDALLRFFAVYYAAISLITFVVQTSASRLALEKLGLAVTTGDAVDGAAPRRASAAWSRPASRARWSRAAANRSSAARSSARATSSSTRRSRPRRSAPPSRSSTSASIASATRSAAASFDCCSRVLPAAQQLPAILSGAIAVRSARPGRRQPPESRLHADARAQPAEPAPWSSTCREVEDLTTRTAMFNTAHAQAVRRSPNLADADAAAHSTGQDRRHAAPDATALAAPDAADRTPTSHRLPRSGRATGSAFSRCFAPRRALPAVARAARHSAARVGSRGAARR